MQSSNIICMKEAKTATIPLNETPFKKLKEGLLPFTPLEECGDVVNSGTGEKETTVSITLVGASGDLAKKKIFAALFALYYEDCLPKHFTIFGYARSKMTDAELRSMVSKTLTCRIDKRANCSEKVQQFLKRCFYHSGQYNSEDNFLELDRKLKEHEVVQVHFYSSFLFIFSILLHFTGIFSFVV